MTISTKDIYSSLRQAICSILGEDRKIVRFVPVSGGDINEAYRLELHDGSLVFMKTNRKENLSFFTTEAAGLRVIAATGAIAAARVLGCGTDEGNGGYAFLLLEYIAGRDRAADYWETFGRELAAMHRAPTAELVPGGRYGFAEDNYIGASRQINTACDNWTAFFRDCRLEPQLRSAAAYFERADLRRSGRLLDQLENILDEPRQPSLLHGDLWSGNVMTGADGNVWLIDPAAYVGHAETDLAMTELFGRFPRRFYDAYREVMPLQPGYADRLDLYHLYHLLNHLNLFGRAYLSPVQQILKRYVWL
ncbi:fructosamine kinase family protein [Lachnospiraceae bacterium JLR.KK008]